MPLAQSTKVGVINAVVAYFLWGLAPIYFKLIAEVSSPEILVHRIVWSFVFLLFIVIALKQLPRVFAILKSSKTMLKLTGTALLLTTNWLLFIWAVNNDHLLDASLGYYINPLFNVALGMIFLSERLRKWQLAAVALAFIGVLIQLITLGTVPIISLALAGTFGLYGLFRKKMAVESLTGLLIESAIVLPMALIYWLLFVESDYSNLLNNTVSFNVLLMAAGIVTTAPLLCFTAAAKRLTLASLGFFQYIGPSMMFLLATFYYNEPLVPEKLVTFGFIWTALIIFSIDSLRFHRKKKLASA